MYTLDDIIAYASARGEVSQTKTLYNNLSAYLVGKYGRKIRKICVDGGFTCPNRDGKCSVGGCIFCSERGSGEHIRAGLNIAEQVKDGLSRLKTGEGAIVYFQNFTNTYAPVPILKERYDSSLIDERIVALAIGTRPDCISEEICQLIASYRDRVDVWVELGLQTSSDKTAQLINRGYKTEVFTEAARMLNEYSIPFVVHLMIGLPGEGDCELLDTLRTVSSVKPFGVKLHSVYVCRGTVLEKMYLRGEYTPIDAETYVRRVITALTYLPKETVIHRLTGDCPSELLVAPVWDIDKNTVIRLINQGLEGKV